MHRCDHGVGRCPAGDEPDLPIHEQRIVLAAPARESHAARRLHGHRLRSRRQRHYAATPAPEHQRQSVHQRHQSRHPTSNSNYSQGYIVTNNGIHLGLTNAKTANYAFVKLVPNASAAGQQAATWSQAPMTIAVGGATGSGLILPDSGIGYSFLTPPAGANITTFNCSGDGCASPGLLVQIYLPGQTTPQQLAIYNFTTGSTTNPLTPESSRWCRAARCSSTPAGSSMRGSTTSSTRSTASSAINGRTTRSPPAMAASRRSSPCRAASRCHR